MNMLRDSSGPVAFCLVSLDRHAIQASTPQNKFGGLLYRFRPFQTPFGF